MPAETPATPALLPLGVDGLLLRFARDFSEEANRAARAYAEAATALPGVTEIVPAPASVLLRFDPLTADAGALHRAALALLQDRDWLALPASAPRRRWQIPVSFAPEDAPDMAEVARACGLTPAQVVEQVEAARPRILAIGFAPGQPYLGLLPPAFDLPRRAQLRDVPPGALTVAIRQLVLFANPSPTGWMQIGRSAFRPFQPEAETPMPLRAGDEVRFIALPPAELAALQDDPLGGARLEVLA